VFGAALLPAQLVVALNQRSLELAVFYESEQLTNGQRDGPSIACGLDDFPVNNLGLFLPRRGP